MMRGSNETKSGPARKGDDGAKLRVKAAGKGGLSLKIFAPAIFFTVIMLGTLGWFGWYSYQHLQVVETQHFRTVQLIGIITHLDEVLTMSARMGAATGDPRWERRYGEFEPELDSAIKELTSLAPEAIMSEAAIQTDSANARLVEMEKEAFRLVGAGDLPGATKILYSDEYSEQKGIYSGGMTDFSKALQEHTAGELRKHRRQILIAALFVAVSASLVLLVWVFMLHKLRYVSQRKRTEKTLRASEERLTAFLDSAPSTFVTFDRALNLTAINGALFEMSGEGLTKDDVIGMNMRDFYPGLEETEEYRQYLEVIETSKTVFIEDVCLGPRFGDVHVSVSAFKTPGGLGLIVTNLSEAEQTLLYSEEKYRQLVANIPDVVWTTDSEGNTTFISDNVEDIYGYSPEEIYAEGDSLWFGRIHPDDVERVKRAFEELLEEDVALDLEYRIQNKDGEWMWLHDRSVATYEREGVRYADGIFTDITKRKEAEQEARTSQTLVQGILDTTDALVIVRDTEGRYLYVNKRVEDILGMDSADIIGKTPFAIHSKAKAEEILADDKKVIDSGKLVEIEDKLEVRGETRVFLGSKFPLLDGSGGLYAVCTAVGDITDYRAAEEALRESESKLRSIIHHSNEVFFIHDTQNHLTYVSPQSLDVFGYTPEEMMVEWTALITDNPMNERGLVLTKKAVETGKKQDLYVLEVNTKGGELKFVEIDESPVKDENGTVVGVSGALRDVTKRRKAEDAVRGSQEGLAIAQRVAHVGSWERDLNSGQVTWSDEALRMLGLEPGEAELNFELFMSYVHPEDKDRVREAVENALSDSPSRVEFRITRADGVERVFDGQGELLRDSNGEPSKILGICQDVTDRKKAEDALKDSEEKFRRITEHSFDAVLAADLTGILTYASPSVIRVLGYAPDEMVGRGPADFMTESSVENVKQVLSKIYGGEDSPAVIEIDVWKKDGTAAKMELNSGPVRKDGEVIGAQASLRDITERKRAEEALRESEERYRTVVENAGETIAVISGEGVFEFMNRTGAERLGGKPEDYVGKTMWDIFPKEIADRQVGSVHAVINTGRGMNFVTPTELRGEMRWYNTTIEPLRDSSGAVTSVLIIGRDIHEIKQAEMELDAYGEKMTQAERLASLGTISATLAHELTQPLTVISLSIEDSLTELEGVSCPRTVKEGLRDSLKEVGNVTTIVERFRNFARKSSAKTVNKVNVKAVADRIVKLLSRSAQHAMVDLHLRGMASLPTVYFNEKEIEQLFFALAQNSIQAAGGKERHNLIIEGAVKEEYIELRFEDDCGGVRECDVDCIFEPFFTTKAAGEGTGLGLCIVQRVAERSGGQVRVDNRPGDGLTIIVTLGISEKRTS